MRGACTAKIDASNACGPLTGPIGEQFILNIPWQHDHMLLCCFLQAGSGLMTVAGFGSLLSGAQWLQQHCTVLMLNLVNI
jgi:hypothetical protein